MESVGEHTQMYNPIKDAPIMRKIVLFVIFALLCSCEISDIHNKKNDIVIYGMVSDANDGKPLANVTIRDEYTEVGAVGSTVTGFDGNYEFHISSPIETVMLLVEKDNYESQSYKLPLSKLNKDNTIQVDFKLRRLSIQYIGRVTNTQDIPIPNTKVYATILRGSTRENVAATFADDNGKFVLSVPNQTYDTWSYYITASVDGYSNKTIKMGHTPNDNGKNFVVNFQMEKE